MAARKATAKAFQPIAKVPNRGKQPITTPKFTLQSQGSPNAHHSKSQDTNLLPEDKQKRSKSGNHSKTEYKKLPKLASTALSILYHDRQENLVYKEATSPKHKKILANEVRMLRLLKKKNVDFGLIQQGSTQSTENPLLVMKYVGESTLTDAVNSLSNDDRRSIARLMVANIQKIHRAGYIHRDLKPDNIMVTKTGIGGYAYGSIIDFGLARPVANSQEGFCGGTPPYSPSTQNDPNLKTHTAMDWYAVARVLIVLFGKFAPSALNAGLQGDKFIDIIPELKNAGYTNKAATSIGEFVKLATMYTSDRSESQDELSKKAVSIINYF